MFSVLLFVLASISVSFQEPLNVTVFYESLCPDSIHFITTQLYPTWTQLSSEYLSFDFVPYGKATQTLDSHGKWHFTCQHGPNECTGNILQACALSALSDSPDLQIEFVECAMNASNPSTAGQACADKLNITYDDISACSTSDVGENLLSGLGNRTLNFQPTITFIPTIAFNGVYTSEDESDSLEDFKAVVCRKISDPKPSACTTQKTNL